MPTETRSVRNRQKGPLTVWLEPLARDFVLQPDQELRIVMAGERLGTCEVVEYPHGTAVYVPVTVDVEVFLDDQKVLHWPRYSEKELPGPPVRFLVENLFGGPGGPTADSCRQTWWQRFWPWS